MKLFSVENLEVLLSPERRKAYFGCISGSLLAPLIRENVPTRNVFTLKLPKKLAIFMNDRAILHSSNAFKLAKMCGAPHIFLNNRSKKPLFKKAKKAGITLIANSPRIQSNFEDKVYFHSFLRKFNLPEPEGLIIRSKADLRQVKTFPSVLQTPKGQGAFGTFVARSRASLELLIKSRTLSYPFLQRRYINGLPYGVTILLDDKNAIVSALRMQAFLMGKNIPFVHDGLGYFFGVQWISLNDISPMLCKKLDKAIKDIIVGLRKSGFRGLANIDFMMTEKDVYFLECNPRIAGSTWQLAQYPELFHGKSFISEYHNLCTGRGLSGNFEAIAKSNFRGATLDLDAHIPELKRKGFPRRKSTDPVGIYSLSSKGLKFVSRNLKQLKSPKNFLVFPATIPHDKHRPNDGLGIILSSRPLYKAKGKRVMMTELGKELFQVSERVVF